MENCGAVQKKISCVFHTAVLDEQSNKREGQAYKVVATDAIKESALDNDIHNAMATEKLDGTCVYIAKYQGEPWLWARFDRKPTKNAERKFRKFQQQQQKLNTGSGSQTKYDWDMKKDFKETPVDWIPASGVSIVDGSPVPDDIGHTPGWVPVSSTARQYCWHLSAVDLKNGLALVLREDEDSGDLLVECSPLSKLEGHTAELIGTNINGNPYGLGTKTSPVHLLVVHGSIPIKNPPILTSEAVKEWFETKGLVEGIVWHCAKSNLFKVHRNHVALPWPPAEVPLLSRRPVTVKVDTSAFEMDNNEGLLCMIGTLNGQKFESIRDIHKSFAFADS